MERRRDRYDDGVGALDELGDLLLNVAFQTVIAEESATFTRTDVVAARLAACTNKGDTLYRKLWRVRRLADDLLVAERVPHRFPANDHNEPYLQAKARGLGHIF